MEKTGRNDPCPCGSGRKFKHCCDKGTGQRPNRVVIPVAHQGGTHRRSVPIPEAIRIGQAYHKANDLVRAEHSYRLVLEAQPDNPDALFYLGMIRHQCGNSASALQSIEQAIAIKADAPAFHYGHGNILLDIGRTDEAIDAYKRAIALDPRQPDFHNNLGQALQAQGELSEALHHYDRAIELQPGHFNAHVNSAYALQRHGRSRSALARFQQAMALRPDDPLPFSYYLYVLNYLPEEPQAVFGAHKAFAERHERPLLAGAPAHADRRHPVSRLRIGYVSPDFRQHSVAHFITPVLEHHDPAQFEVFCYYNHPLVDDVTRHLQTRVPHWRTIAGRSDADVAAQVQRDGIDILVDLAGHSVNHRLLVFARKPAPVQVTWLGYPNTTGLASVDYRISDGLADPIGQTEALHTEKLVRMPDCFSCYRPPAEATDVGPLPAAATGQVSFGSFNNLEKITPHVVAVWAAILRAVPESRLLLKYIGLDSRFMQALVQSRFAEHGISSDRVTLLGADVSQQEHLMRYNAVDIGLDPFPYNGTTTTCDALWMGVPVITLAGRVHAGRVGVSQLTQLQMTDLIAHTPDQYVEIAVALANDRERLAQLRQGLRARMSASPLTDERRFTRNLEAAFWTMWEDWVTSD